MSIKMIRQHLARRNTAMQILSPSDNTSRIVPMSAFLKCEVAAKPTENIIGFMSLPKHTKSFFQPKVTSKNGEQSTENSLLRMVPGLSSGKKSTFYSLELHSFRSYLALLCGFTGSESVHTREFIELYVYLAENLGFSVIQAHEELVSASQHGRMQQQLERWKSLSEGLNGQIVDYGFAISQMMELKEHFQSVSEEIFQLDKTLGLSMTEEAPSAVLTECLFRHESIALMLEIDDDFCEPTFCKYASGIIRMVTHLSMHKNQLVSFAIPYDLKENEPMHPAIAEAIRRPFSL